MALELPSYERYNADVNKWADELIATLRAQGIRIIESADLVQENPSIVVLPTDGFLSFCEATGQKVVFLYRGDCNVSEKILSMIEEIYEQDEDPALLIRSFEAQNVLLVKRAQVLCPTHFYAELFVLHQGGFVNAGVVAQPFDDLIQALTVFCENAEERREEAQESQEAIDSETLEKLADELMRDSDFVAIRGKRKRCVYVQEKYGQRVPPSKRGELRRVDQNSMDANLVSLVEHVTDRLDMRRA